MDSFIEKLLGKTGEFEFYGGLRNDLGNLLLCDTNDFPNKKFVYVQFHFSDKKQVSRDFNLVRAKELVARKVVRESILNPDEYANTHVYLVDVFDMDRFYQKSDQQSLFGAGNPHLNLSKYEQEAVKASNGWLMHYSSDSLLVSKVNDECSSGIVSVSNEQKINLNSKVSLDYLPGSAIIRLS